MATIRSASEFADERQTRIAHLVTARGRVRTAELVKELGVTDPTVRKDLAALQERGILKRTHGGAIALRPLSDRELAARASSSVEPKDRIGKAALQLFESGQSVFLDSGTTVDRIAVALATALIAGAAPGGLTVVTTSLAVATSLAGAPGVEHLLLGGRVVLARGSVVGPVTLSTLEPLTFDMAILGASGFAAPGVTAADIDEAQIKSAVLDRSRRAVVAADHTKVGAVDFARVRPLDEIDVVVTDVMTSELEELCTEAHIQVIAAERDGLA
jgi:DeoR/GlpR family transcriptional regulator of sugar metabolism